MSQTAMIQVRVGDELKKAADDLFSDLGFDTPTAIRMFLTRAVKQQGMPFSVSQIIPNAETLEALEEGRRLLRDSNAKTYSSFSELLTEVENEV